MKALFNLSIKGRFNLFLAVIVVIFIVIIIFFGFSIKTTSDYRNYDKQLDKLIIEYLTMRRFEGYFLLRHPDDDDFYRTGKNKYLRKHLKSNKDLVKIIDELNENEISKELNLGEHMSKLKKYNRTYNGIFIELANRLYEKGSIESGVIGEMKRTGQAAYMATENPTIVEYILLLRKSEKDYLLDKDINFFRYYVETFNELSDYISENAIKNMETSLSDSTGLISIDSVVFKKDLSIDHNLITLLNEYKKNFINLVEIDKDIGLTANEGLNGELRIEIHKFDPELDLIKDVINEEKESVLKNTIRALYIFVSIVIIVLFYVIIRFSTSIISPINKLKKYLHPLSKGILPENIMEFRRKDELSEMIQAINELIIGLKKTTSFAAKIGQGVFSTEFTALSEKDTLGNSLLEMRKNLDIAKKEDEKRKYEDSLRKWANEGLAKFNEIMRQSTKDLGTLSSKIVKNLVQFLNSNQSGLFIYNDNNKENIYLELIATYAYNKERKKQKRIGMGDGLVGMCAEEKTTIYLTEIPDSYLSIRSGLGQSNPRSLLIVPLKLEEQIFGVIEIASFNKFEQYEIDFVEKVSESIASTLSIAKINSRTSELLEQSQQQAEEMAAQEEEMRQNLEELQATQDESARKEAEMSSILGAINKSSLVIEFDIKGKIVDVNKAMCNLLGVSKEQMVGKHQSDFDELDEKNIRKNTFWEKLKNGENITETHHIKVKNKEYWLHEIYTPILDENGVAYKIMNLATDITESKKLENELREKTDEMLAQEEELRQNLEELEATQDEMGKRQEKLQFLNEKMKANEEILNKAIQRVQDQEKKLKIKNEELISSEEELRQNMEELQSTQDQLKIQNITITNNEKKLKRLTTSVPGMIFQLILNITSNETIFKYASINSHKLLGYSPEELVSLKNANKVLKIHKEDLDDFRDAISRTSENLKTLKWEGRIITKSGKYIWIEINIQPERMTQSLVLWNGIMQNIDNQKSMEKEIDDLHLETLQKASTLAINEEITQKNIIKLEQSNEKLLKQQNENILIRKELQDRELELKKTLEKAQLQKDKILKQNQKLIKNKELQNKLTKNFKEKMENLDFDLERKTSEVFSLKRKIAEVEKKLNK